MGNRKVALKLSETGHTVTTMLEAEQDPIREVICCLVLFVVINVHASLRFTWEAPPVSATILLETCGLQSGLTDLSR